MEFNTNPKFCFKIHKVQTLLILNMPQNFNHIQTDVTVRDAYVYLLGVHDVTLTTSIFFKKMGHFV